MSIFLRKVTVADPLSPHNGEKLNIRIADGKIFMCVDEPHEKDEIIEAEGLTALPAFTDPFCFIGEPGLEYKETMASAAQAAQAGGYGRLMMLPNTKPAMDTAAQVSFVVEKSKSLPVDILPVGAISNGCKGDSLAEMYDMFAAGAVAFSDGLHPMQNAQVMLKALQYGKTVGATAITMPVEENLTRHALMHEGVASTRFGLPGMPAMAEHLMLQRDLALVEYTGGKLHITGISTAESVSIIRQAKAKGLAVSCSVTPYHLHFTDDMLEHYDSNLKVNPPLRSSEDVAALRAAVLDGTIDCIASHHQPQEWDAKTCEFEYAAYGMSTLEACFGAVKAACPEISADRLAAIFTHNTNSVFGLPANTIAEGQTAAITLVALDETYVFDSAAIRSKGKNNAFVGRTLQGKVAYTIYKNILTKN